MVLKYLHTTDRVAVYSYSGCAVHIQSTLHNITHHFYLLCDLQHSVNFINTNFKAWFLHVKEGCPTYKLPGATYHVACTRRGMVTWLICCVDAFPLCPRVHCAHMGICPIAVLGRISPLSLLPFLQQMGSHSHTHANPDSPSSPFAMCHTALPLWGENGKWQLKEKTLAAIMARVKAGRQPGKSLEAARSLHVGRIWSVICLLDSPDLCLTSIFTSSSTEGKHLPKQEILFSSFRKVSAVFREQPTLSTLFVWPQINTANYLSNSFVFSSLLPCFTAEEGT